MGVEGKLVHLARVLVQPGELDGGAVQIIEDDFAIGSGGGNVGAELAVRPFDIVDAKAVAMASM